jgi:hypothetical protein
VTSKGEYSPHRRTSALTILRSRKFQSASLGLGCRVPTTPRRNSALSIPSEGRKSDQCAQPGMPLSIVNTSKGAMKSGDVYAPADYRVALRAGAL